MGPNIHNPGLQAKVAKLGTPNGYVYLIVFSPVSNEAL